MHPLINDEGKPLLHLLKIRKYISLWRTRIAAEYCRIVTRTLRWNCCRTCLLESSEVNNNLQYNRKQYFRLMCSTNKPIWWHLWDSKILKALLFVRKSVFLFRWRFWTDFPVHLSRTMAAPLTPASILREFCPLYYLQNAIPSKVWTFLLYKLRLWGAKLVSIVGEEQNIGFITAWFLTSWAHFDRCHQIWALARNPTWG